MFVRELFEIDGLVEECCGGMGHCKERSEAINLGPKRNEIVPTTAGLGRGSSEAGRVSREI